ncbi:hypothetical protein H4R19_002299 [Coemansia spiralis]|nr:hypothetical protein H4R19_002299 [Coemansia spiralis]
MEGLLMEGQIRWPEPPQHAEGPINLCVPVWAYDDRYLGQPIVPHVVAGPYHLVRNVQFLAVYRIEMILCIRDPSELQFLRERELPGVEFRFMDVPTDVYKASILPHFAEANRLIAGLVAAGRNVLVCCSDGIDKSSAFVSAYLMETYALKAQDAITFVQNQRYCATPSVNGYRVKLTEFEPICAARAAAPAGEAMGMEATNALRRRAEDDPSEPDAAFGEDPEARPMAAAHKRRAH